MILFVHVFGVGWVLIFGVVDSYFGKQDGDFSIEIRSISARIEKDGEEKRDASSLRKEYQDSKSEGAEGKDQQAPKGGWVDMLSGWCTVS